MYTTVYRYGRLAQGRHDCRLPNTQNSRKSNGGTPAMTGPTADYDVIVIGGGNAGFSAAHAAAERGRRVVVLERGTAEMAGGNSYFTAGATRIGHARTRRPRRLHRIRRTSCAHRGAALQPRRVSRRPEQGHRRSHRPRPGPRPGHRGAGRRALAALTGPAVPAHVRAAGLRAARRQLPVLGRAARGQRRRGRRAHRRPHPRRGEARHRDPLRHPGDRAGSRGRSGRRRRSRGRVGHQASFAPRA